MRKFVVSWGLAIGALAAVGGAPSRAQDSGLFDFSVCNETRSKASVAISSRYAPGSSDFVVAGWWVVEPGSCRRIGAYPRGHFYTFAKAPNGNFWGRGDLHLCTEQPGPFKRINLKTYKCSNDLLKPFNHVEVVKSSYEWTLNP
ncbi:DUF1036 domain-containing protein [Siculibacillus lacustris]|uniref:DUF1036 domain-containing protein n=1 Tax=Siculibacillus lacustris TaxID=1549641 RepID=A0A4Q9VYX1_9HYPH|nr:DUF1036 domain-containing protein [Siculibacillus lacustris]TBW40443.1 DUF1036 domain-containing protein [Siculibacillus lacustris]